jgi:hypothetical protein
MSRSSTLAATSDEGYSLAELCTDIAKDLKVIFAMGKMDPKYKRVARSLMSIIAHPRARMSVRAVASVLGVTVYQAWMARKHAESHFAGACVEHVIHKRCAIPEDVAIHLSAYSVSGEMCKVRMAPMRNAISKALLERNMPITQLYKKYLAEVKRLERAGSPLTRAVSMSKFRKVMSARIFTDPAAEEAACEICLEYIIEVLEDIGKLIDKLGMWLSNEPKTKQLKQLLKVVGISIRTGEFASHQSQGHSGTLMHDTMHALSDPHNSRLAEDCTHDLAMDCPVCNGPFYLESEIRACINRLEHKNEVELPALEEMRVQVSELFGTRKLIRGLGHVVRDRRQSQSRIDYIKELQDHQCFYNVDYCSKLDRKKNRMGKTEGFGGAKVSLSGTLVLLKIPKPGTVGVKWEHFPEGAEQGKPELQGKYIQVFVQVYCDDSNQDGWHALGVHEVMDKVIKMTFPHLTEVFMDCDNGPHYQNAGSILRIVENFKRTGLRLRVVTSCEPGEGKWFSDAKFAHIKYLFQRAIKYDLGDAVCARTFCKVANDLGGESSSIIVFLDADTMKRDVQVPMPAGAITGIDHYRVKETTDDAEPGLILRRSHRVGVGILLTAEQIEAKWKGKKWPCLGCKFEVGSNINTKMKGTFEEERDARKSKLKATEIRRQERAAKLADDEGKVLEMERTLRAIDICNSCGAKLEKGDTEEEVQRILADHAVRDCHARLPARHKFPCVVCSKASA